MLVPRRVIDELIDTVLSVRDYIIMGSVGVGIATIATAGLVFLLSIRLRKREIETVRKIGGTGRRLKAILASEILIVVALSAVVTTAMVLMVSRYGMAITNLFVG
jgi:putative ABC transport system permease protein